MDSKSIKAAFIGAIVTGIAGIVVADVAGVWKRGEQGEIEDAIRVVLVQELDAKLSTTMGGETKTFGEALSKINENQVILINRVTTLEAAMKAMTE